MTLTSLQKALVNECARLMGRNGGLAYECLMSDTVARQRPGSRSAIHNRNNSTMRHVKKKYGLPFAYNGEVVYVAVRKRDARMRIFVPPPVKPNLDGMELSVLECAAMTLVPRGGFFKGYGTILENSTGLDHNTAHAAIRALTQKFNTPNLELAIVSAFASGILNPVSLFGPQLPIPLIEIMNSDSFLNASEHPVIGMQGRLLSDDEKMIARELIRIMGINGGLFWGMGNWLGKAALAVGKNQTGRYPLESMRRKLGISRTGLLLYAVSEILEESVDVKVPLLCGTDFDEVEYRVMLASAITLVKNGGFYNGYRQSISDLCLYNPDYVNRINRRVVIKTGTANLGQAVTYFIAHRLIPVSSLRLDVQRTPALEAIVTAMSKITA